MQSEDHCTKLTWDGADARDQELSRLVLMQTFAPAMPKMKTANLERLEGWMRRGLQSEDPMARLVALDTLGTLVASARDSIVARAPASWGGVPFQPCEAFLLVEIAREDNTEEHRARSNTILTQMRGHAADKCLDYWVHGIARHSYEEKLFMHTIIAFAYGKLGAKSQFDNWRRGSHLNRRLKHLLRGSFVDLKVMALRTIEALSHDRVWRQSLRGRAIIHLALAEFVQRACTMDAHNVAMRLLANATDPECWTSEFDIYVQPTLDCIRFGEIPVATEAYWALHGMANLGRTMCSKIATSPALHLLPDHLRSPMPFQLPAFRLTAILARNGAPFPGHIRAAVIDAVLDCIRPSDATFSHAMDVLQNIGTTDIQAPANAVAHRIVQTWDTLQTPSETIHALLAINHRSSPRTSIFLTDLPKLLVDQYGRANDELRETIGYFFRMFSIDMNNTLMATKTIVCFLANQVSTTRLHTQTGICINFIAALATILKQPAAASIFCDYQDQVDAVADFLFADDCPRAATYAMIAIHNLLQDDRGFDCIATETVVRGLVRILRGKPRDAGQALRILAKIAAKSPYNALLVNATRTAAPVRRLLLQLRSADDTTRLTAAGAIRALSETPEYCGAITSYECSSALGAAAAKASAHDKDALFALRNVCRTYPERLRTYSLMRALGRIAGSCDKEISRVALETIQLMAMEERGNSPSVFDVYGEHFEDELRVRMKSLFSDLASAEPGQKGDCILELPTPGGTFRISGYKAIIQARCASFGEANACVTDGKLIVKGPPSCTARAACWETVVRYIHTDEVMLTDDCLRDDGLSQLCAALRIPNLRDAFPSTWADDMERMLVTKPERSGVQVRTEDGHLLFAHKAILAARSPIFKAMLDEKANNSKAIGAIPIKASFATSRIVLKYLHCGVHAVERLLATERAGIVSSVLVIANKHKLGALQLACEGAIATALKPKEAMAVLSRLEHVDAPVARAITLACLANLQRKKRLRAASELRSMSHDKIKSTTKAIAHSAHRPFCKKRKRAAQSSEQLCSPQVKMEKDK
ncbi:Speckle-type POZ protein [Hondaea fermentalgiana]|uniref:Speckle-type POZ protein n=1 Tax=Hondaea fermentalgiana TaxID=2315210 RepID=A0A2R5GU50_9STRA|nr:Speckle-type POZ protein [Hondaea fermentalgiana]|eukprot:GBG34396.1 Speckle-type POZ protein [Hondaea fermentalgiana]